MTEVDGDLLFLLHIGFSFSILLYTVQFSEWAPCSTPTHRWVVPTA